MDNASYRGQPKTDEFLEYQGICCKKKPPSCAAIEEDCLSFGECDERQPYQ